MPLISVIIPNYNHARYLNQRIDSVMNQTFQDFEVIILDDCSTDNSKLIIEGYRNNGKVTHIVYNEVNTGSPFKQWQKGLELSKGEYIWIAESDDWASPDFMEILLNEIFRYENVGVCFAGSNWVDDSGNTGEDLSVYQESFFIEGREEIRKKLVKYNTIQNASSALIKRTAAISFIEKATPFKAAGDWIFYIDILMDSNLAFVGRKLNNFRWYHNNTSNKAAKDGLWITEGLKVMVDSDLFKLKFTRSERRDIYQYWLQNTRQFGGWKRFYFECRTFLYLSFFFIKSRTAKG